MNAIIKYFAKKYALAAVNEGIKAIQAKKDLEPYKAKVKEILAACTMLSLALDDNEITKEEAEAVCDAVKALFAK